MINNNIFFLEIMVGVAKTCLPRPLNFNGYSDLLVAPFNGREKLS